VAKGHLDEAEIDVMVLVEVAKEGNEAETILSGRQAV
jgi:hypothetical protein